jgi:Zn-dependent M28 family amino/carboxypeptidase
MQRFFLLVSLSLLTITNIFSQDIDLQYLKNCITVLSADSLKGRKTGSPEEQMAASFILKQFKEAGLEPWEGGLQRFQVTTNVKVGNNNLLSFQGFSGKPKSDFMPLSMSENKQFESDVVFAGYGFDINLDSLKWDDYNNIDVKGKWVLILKGDPEFEKSNSKFVPYADDWSKVLKAKDKGAAGVILVAGPKVEKKDSLADLYFDKSDARAGIPAMVVTRKVANLLIASSENTVEKLEEKLNKDMKPCGFNIPVKVNASLDIEMTKADAMNVVAMLPGTDPVLKKEFMVIGGHFDHLGMGGPGSGSRMPDTNAVHNGADDNASGAAGVIALAKSIAKSKIKMKRSIIFVAFSGEEMGLLGSKNFTRHPPVELSKIKTMFNLDMIGRLKSDTGTLVISGTGTSTEGEDILTRHSKNRIFPVKYSPEGFGSSDHSSFYIENIPVFFFTTGAHEDYHTPADDADRINYTGEKAVLEYVYDVIVDVTNRDQALTFKEAGPKSSPRMGQRFKVTLGILPDFTSSDNKGLRVDGTRKDGPAQRAGVLKGDLIVAIDGKPVTNIYEYMDRLKTLEAGKTCNIDIIRNGKLIILLVQL